MILCKQGENLEYLNLVKEEYLMKTANVKLKTKRKNSYNRSEMIANLMMILPFVLLLLVFNYLPMFGAIIAFKDYKPNIGIFQSPWAGLENFKYFFQSNDFLRILRNTVSYGVTFQILGVISALTVAVLLYNVQSKKALKYYQTTFLFSNFISFVLMAFIVYAFLSPTTGILNNLIMKMGGEKINWYSEPKYWPVILTLSHLWKHVGMDSMIYYAALIGIDESLFEAARLDGATKWQEIKYVMIPSISTVICTLLILGVGSMISGEFGLFYQLPMNVGVLYPTTDIINTYVFRGLENVNNMGTTSAVGLFQSVTAAILVVLSNYIVKKINPEDSLF